LQNKKIITVNIDIDIDIDIDINVNTIVMTKVSSGSGSSSHSQHCDNDRIKDSNLRTKRKDYSLYQMIGIKNCSVVDPVVELSHPVAASFHQDSKILEKQRKNDCRRTVIATYHSMTDREYNADIMINPTVSTRMTNCYKNFSNWWITILSSCQSMIMSTIALWIVPICFTTLCTVFQLLEIFLVKFFGPVYMLLEQRTTIGKNMMENFSIVQIMDLDRSISNTLDMMIHEIPKVERMTLFALAMIILMSIGSFCSWLEQRFLDTQTEQDMSPPAVIKTNLVSQNVAQYWVRNEQFLFLLMNFY